MKSYHTDYLLIDESLTQQTFFLLFRDVIYFLVFPLYSGCQVRNTKLIWKTRRLFTLTLRVIDHYFRLNHFLSWRHMYNISVQVISIALMWLKIRFSTKNLTFHVLVATNSSYTVKRLDTKWISSKLCFKTQVNKCKWDGGWDLDRSIVVNKNSSQIELQKLHP